MAKVKKAKSASSTLTKFVRDQVAKQAAKRKNPDTGKLVLPDLGPVYDIGAGLGTYAGTMILTRAVTNIGALKAPSKFWRHAPPIISAILMATAWLVSSKWKAAKKYQTAILVGSGVALAHAFVRTWLPRLAWLVGSDALPIAAAAAPMKLPGTSQMVDSFDELLPQGDIQLLPGPQEEPEEVENLQYLDDDSYGGNYGKSSLDN